MLLLWKLGFWSYYCEAAFWRSKQNGESPVSDSIEMFHRPIFVYKHTQQTVPNEEIKCGQNVLAFLLQSEFHTQYSQTSSITQRITNVS